MCTYVYSILYMNMIVPGHPYLTDKPYCSNLSYFIGLVQSVFLLFPTPINFNLTYSRDWTQQDLGFLTLINNTSIDVVDLILDITSRLFLLHSLSYIMGPNLLLLYTSSCTL